MSTSVRSQLAAMFADRFANRIDPNGPPNLIELVGETLDRFPNVTEEDFLGAMSDAKAELESRSLEASGGAT